MQQAYRVLIFEDSPADEQALVGLLRRFGSEHGCEFQIAWRPSGLDLFADKSHYDLCLMDIDMPGIDGMETAQLIRAFDETVPIIFVTNLAKYAVRGYEVGAAGFILKPVSYGDLCMTLRRALRQVDLGGRRSVAVATEDGVRVVPLVSLVYVEVQGHRLTYHLAEDEPLVVRGTLDALRKQLADAPMVQVSRSCLANMDKVVNVQGDEVVMATGERLHMPRGQKRTVMAALADHFGGVA